MSHEHGKKSLLDRILDWGILIGSIFALVMANLLGEMYHEITHILHFGVNDVLMVIFFAQAGAEIRRAFSPKGAFADPKAAIVPLVGTAGGVIVPAAIYLLVNALFNGTIGAGWPAATPTDIAFALLIARLFGLGPVGTVTLLSIAILDDAIGMVLIATLFSQPQHLEVFFGLVAISLGIVGAMRVAKVTAWQWYIIPTVVSWFAFHEAGFHPTLSVLPVIFLMPMTSMEAFEHWSKKPVQVILMLFGFVNAGVELSSFGLATGAVALGLNLGKPLGIIGFVWLGLKFGLTLPKGMSFNEVTKVGTIASVGFTVSLFISGLAFSDAHTLEAAKIGALVSLPVAIALTWVVSFVDKKYPKLFDSFEPKKNSIQE